jgi:hypothetical protein
VSDSGHDGAREVDRKVVVFGEEIAHEPSLAALLAEVQDNLRELTQRYSGVVSAAEQFEIADTALTELDAALERVRAARARLLRIELRLATRYERAVAQLRAAEQALASEDDPEA